MTIPQELGITLKCIKGEEWPATSFRSSLDLKAESVTEESITFYCPLWHSFTLAQAIQKGIFSPELAQKFLAFAMEQFPLTRADYEQRMKEGWKSKPSHWIVNQEIVAKGWKCVHCGNQAHLALSKKTEEYALCRNCAADWSNLLTDLGFDGLTDRKEARILFRIWDFIWERFVQKLSISQIEATNFRDSLRAKREKRKAAKKK
ncbi:MAG TPA: hypothetical protein VJC15_02690 [Candidatus Paceibacterota bacterium]